MTKSISGLRVTTSRSSALNKSLQRLAKTVVYVGIGKGEKGDARQDEEISNSDLGFIHEYGAPGANIPPRPFLRPGIESGKEAIAAKMQAALVAAIHDDEKALNTALDQAGILSVSSVQAYMAEGDFEPLKASSIRSRKYSRKTKSKRAGEKNGNVKPLVNSGTLQKSMSYYVRKV